MTKGGKKRESRREGVGGLEMEEGREEMEQEGKLGQGASKLP